VSFLSAKKVCGLGGPVSEIEMLYYALDEESTDQKYTIYALIVAKRVTESVNDLAMRSVGAIARRFTLRIPVSPLSTGSQFSSSSCPMIVNGFICPLFKAWKEQGEGEGVQIEERTFRFLGRLDQQVVNLPAAAPYLTTARNATLIGCMEGRWCPES
jgi:hypothetical protein